MYDDEVDVPVQVKKNFVELFNEKVSKLEILRQPLSLRQLP
jgi:hypothetical protein